MPPTDEESFQRLLQEVRKGMPDAESAAQITKGFQKHWDKPPLVELELLLQRTTSLRDARLLLFFPEPVDMASYVALCTRAPAGAPPEHPQNKVRVPFLAVLYMLHVQNWPLMRAFIHEGGLRTLADNVADDNIYLRAQAIDCMMQLTNTELHDWFAEPTLEPSTAACADTNDAVMTAAAGATCSAMTAYCSAYSYGRERYERALFARTSATVFISRALSIYLF